MPSAPKRHHLRGPGKVGDRPKRPPPRAQGYSRTWDKISLYYRKRHPICEVEGCWQPSTETHHINPVRETGRVLVPDDELMALCHWHHMQIEAEGKA